MKKPYTKPFFRAIYIGNEDIVTLSTFDETTENQALSRERKSVWDE